MPRDARDALIPALGDDPSAARLEPADRAMLEYVTKLTLTPGAMEEADVEALREAGFDDVAIHDICAVAAYFAFVNRIADGLGVELEETRADGDLGGDCSRASGPGGDGPAAPSAGDDAGGGDRGRDT